MERETMLTMLAHGLGLNVSGLVLLAGAGAILGPLSWSGMVVALLLKLIGDSHLIRAYWLWQTRSLSSQTQP